jgi:hypothetical protein
MSLQLSRTQPPCNNSDSSTMVYPVRVLEAAVGAKCGLATPHIADKVEPTCTLSAAFIARMENRDER